MIEIIQTGQFGKTKSIIEMHKVRKLIFKDRMGWDVDLTQEGLEVDNYDLPETVYIIARDNLNRVAGVWRILPSSCPSMIRDIWPDFLNSFDMPINDSAWEASRFGVQAYHDNPKDNIRSVSKITSELIVALLKVCVITGIESIYTMYNLQIARSVRKVGFFAEETSKEILIEDKPSVVGRVRTDAEALVRVQEKTGIDFLLTFEDLPPILQEMAMKNMKIIERARNYA